MTERINENLQWAGASGIIMGHTLNSIGPGTYPWNIVAFFLGTVFFAIWATRVINRPQILVNAVSLVIAAVGLSRAFGI
jgi:hypothetical protein